VLDRGDAVFRRDSPVLVYWLSRCDGFAVRRGRRAVGEVQGVATQDHLGRAEVLRVRSLSRQKLLPADRVAAVVPSRRLLILEHEQTRLRRGARAVVAQRHHVARGARALVAQRHHAVRGAHAVAEQRHRVLRGAHAVLRQRHGIARVAVASWVAAKPHLVAAARACANAAERLARLTILWTRRGGAWLEREVRRTTPIVLAATERGLTRAGRATGAASRAGADAARTLGSEMRQRSRR
jgi:hypothetical protein